MLVLTASPRAGPPVEANGFCTLVIPQMHARAHWWPVRPRHASDDIHGAALPESVSRSPERVRGGDDRRTRAGCVRTKDRESWVPDWHVGDPGYSGSPSREESIGDVPH